MGYDDMKDYRGRKYTGMAIGGEHVWIYPNGIWREMKVAPDRWQFTFSSVKEREEEAPEGSGAQPDTQYHWYLLAHQWVRKIDKDSYTTRMEGVKHKVAHKRPHWLKWSSEYSQQPTARERVIAILEEALGNLKRGGPPRNLVAFEPY